MKSPLSRPLFLVFSFLLVNVQPAAAADFQWLRPLPQGNGLKDVAFLDDLTAIAVGDAGVVMVTHDGGFTWSVSNLDIGIDPLPAPFSSIARVNALTAVACGGVIYRTTDAGQTWSLVTSEGAKDVDFEDGVGIAISGSRDILRSLDGGLSWPLVYTLPTNIYEVDVVSSTLMVAVGDDFHRSTDGGDTWVTLPISTGDFSASSVSFVDEWNGAVTAGWNILYVTSDGGATWQERILDPVHPGADIGGHEVEMLDEQTIMVAAVNYTPDATGHWTRSGQFLRSSDSGATWTSDFGQRVFRAMARNAAGAVLLVGDGGIVCRWTEADGIEQTAGSQDEWSDGAGLSFLDRNHGLVFGTSNSYGELVATATTVLRTNDGGETWSSNQLASTRFTDVFMTPDAVYAVGGHPEAGEDRTFLAKSVDGGSSWTTLWSGPEVYRAPPRPYGLQAVAFGSSSHGVAVGARNTVLVIDHDVVTAGTVDGVKIWLTVFDVAMADDAVALCVRSESFPPDYGEVWRSTDGGTTWALAFHPVGPSYPLYAVAFASPQVCVAGGENRIYRSVDGGVTWAQVVLNDLFPEIHAIAFASPSHGLAVGTRSYNGIVYETWDAGETWTFVGYPTKSTLNDVACFEPFEAVMSGDGLEILQYVNQPVPTLISSFTARSEPMAAALRWDIHDGSTPLRFEVTRREGRDTRTIASDLAASTRSYRDEAVVPGSTYEYTLVVVDEDGSVTRSMPVNVTIASVALRLLPNQPNPFNPSTTIRFVTPERGLVRLSVYDVAGRHVATLVNDVRTAGSHSVEWNGRDDRGQPVASGVYLSRLESAKGSATQKMMLIK